MTVSAPKRAHNIDFISDERQEKWAIGGNCHAVGRA
jgi:hypothetical protein